MSMVALQIVQASLKEDVTVAELGRLAQSDPGFALRVISMVNSAAFGGRKTDDVMRASMMLGVRGLRNLGLSLAVTDMAPTGDDGQQLLACCLRRAAACRLLAERSGEREVDRFFTTGLFLDVGLLARAREDLSAAAAVARVPANDRCVLERSLWRADHASTGSRLAADFNLDAEQVAAIRAHHAPSPPAEPLARLSWVAERFAGAWERGDVGRLREVAFQAARAIGIDQLAAERVLAEIPNLASSVAQGLSRPMSDQALAATLIDVNRSLAELNQSYETMVRGLEATLAEKDRLARALAEANARLEALALMDSLTGIANRRAAEDALARALAQADRAGSTLGVLLLDVDHFKRVNDAYGHDVGDQVLAHVGNVLRSEVRTGDFPARFGGEEFLVILQGAPPQGAWIAAERIRKSLESKLATTARGELRVTASIGAACATGPGCAGAIKGILKRADLALYEAKQAGRNRVVVAR